MADQLPRIYYSSDVDGARFAIIDAAEIDMTGWSVVETDPSGVGTRSYPVEKSTAWRVGGGGELSLNPYLPADEFREVWLALAEEPSELVSPDGARYGLHGRES